jgi:hypothetical protein
MYGPPHAARTMAISPSRAANMSASQKYPGERTHFSTGGRYGSLTSRVQESLQFGGAIRLPTSWRSRAFAVMGYPVQRRPQAASA